MKTFRSIRLIDAEGGKVSHLPCLLLLTRSSLSAKQDPRQRQQSSPTEPFGYCFINRALEHRGMIMKRSLIKGCPRLRDGACTQRAGRAQTAVHMHAPKVAGNNPSVDPLLNTISYAPRLYLVVVCAIAINDCWRQNAQWDGKHLRAAGAFFPIPWFRQMARDVRQL